MLNFSDVEFHYEPFAIGRALNVLDGTLYDQLVDSFPPVNLFNHKVHRKDDKYYFNEVRTRAAYLDWINNHEPWREFHRWLKSKDFIFYVLDMLAANQIDLGIRRQRLSPARQGRRLLGDIIRRGRHPRFERSLYTRFEFSMLAADGGFIRPHTDAPAKIVTLVISMVREGEWDNQVGGSLVTCRPKKLCHSFNHVNHFIDFDEIEPLHDFEFVQNQCIIFITTFNSYHCVPLMQSADSELMRRTVTINIEYE